MSLVNRLAFAGAMSGESTPELHGQLSEAAHAEAPRTRLAMVVASYRLHTRLIQRGETAPSQPLSSRRPWSLSLFEIVAIAYLVWVAVAELVTTFGNPRLGMGLHAALLTALLFHAAFARGEDQRRFLLALSLAPLIRIFSLSLPLQHLQILYWYASVAVPLFVAGISVAWTLRLSRRDLGFTLHDLPFQLLFGASGFLLGLIEYFILRPQPLIPHLTPQAFALPALIILVGTGLAEEFVFRGIMQSASRGVMGALTILYVSLVFASLHIGYKSAVDLVFVFSVGLLFAVVVQRTGSILGTTLSHGVANIALYLVVPFLGIGGAVAPSALTTLPAAAVSAPRAATQEAVPTHSSAPAVSTALSGATAPVQTPSSVATPAPGMPALAAAAALASQHAASIIHAAQVAATPQPPAPAAAPQPTPATLQPAPTPVLDVVLPGDTLSAIAVRYGTSVAYLAALNAIPNPNLLYPGQVLLIRSAP